MKKLLAMAVVALLGAGAAQGQEIRDMFGKDQKDDIAYGVRAGLNISSIKGEWSPGNGLDLKSRTGFQIGAVVDLPVFNGFYVQPGLSFTTRGARKKVTDDGETVTTKLLPFYLQIPVLASFRADVSPSVNVQVNVGPHLAIGLGGKYKEEYSYDGKTEKDDMPFFGKSKEGDNGEHFGAKRFDFGLSFGAGVTVKERYYVGIQYDLGLINMAIHDDKFAYGDKTKFHNGNFAILVGYNF